MAVYGDRESSGAFHCEAEVGGGEDAVHKKNPKHRDSVLLGYAPNVTPNSISGFSEPLGH